MLDLAAIRARLQTVVPGALHRQAAADIAALLSELDRLQSGGCARDQRTTQFCAEVVAKDAEIRRLTAELAAAQAEIAQLRPVVEWRQMLDGRTAVVATWAADMGGFSLRVAEKQWRTRSFPGWKGERPGWAVVFGRKCVAASGPETGEAGKAACEAAFRKAVGL